MTDATVTPVSIKTEGRRKKDEIPEEERILRDARQKQLLINRERTRLDYFRIRHEAAMRIQKAWKMYKFRAKGLMKNARESVRQKRLDAGELEWRRQIAACTIQLAWRKYYRRRLLDSLNVSSAGVAGSGGARKRAMRMWDPAAMATKQRTVMDQIYGEHLYAPDWHPLPRATDRPSYMKEAGSAAALSFNFALEQYYPPSWHDSYYDVIDEEAEAAPARLQSPELTADDIESLEADIQRDMAFLAKGYSKLSSVTYGQQDHSRRGSSY